MNYWGQMQTFTEAIFNGLVTMWSFITSNPMTFTAFAIGAILLALDILFGFGKDNEEE